MIVSAIHKRCFGSHIKTVSSDVSMSFLQRAVHHTLRNNSKSCGSLADSN